MPTAYYVKHPDLTRDQYAESMHRLVEAGPRSPRGRLYQFAFASPSSVWILSIWESREAYDVFAKTLKNVAVDSGIVPVEPELFDVVDIIRVAVKLLYVVPGRRIASSGPNSLRSRR